MSARSWASGSPSGCALIDRVLTQTSDDEYHCLTITLFLAGAPGAYLAEVPAPFRSAVVPRAVR